MPKYQFFCIPNSNRKKFTYIDMGSSSFLNEKQQLLDQGFEVDDSYILASTHQETIDKFKSNYTYVSQEYSNADPSAGLATFLIEIYKKSKVISLYEFCEIKC